MDPLVEEMTGSDCLHRELKRFRAGIEASLWITLTLNRDESTYRSTKAVQAKGITSVAVEKRPAANTRYGREGHEPLQCAEECQHGPGFVVHQCGVEFTSTVLKKQCRAQQHVEGPLRTLFCQALSPAKADRALVAELVGHLDPESARLRPEAGHRTGVPRPGQVDGRRKIRLVEQISAP